MAMLTGAGLVLLFRHLTGFEPTQEQVLALEQLADYLSYETDLQAFILEGFAGTGKTTLISVLTAALDDQGMVTYLMAPTGRAARVMAKYANRTATTIHKFIYTAETAPDGTMTFKLKVNKDAVIPTIYIVDEASMLGEGTTGERNLLHDLLYFIFSEDTEHKLIFVGDPAQLPPVRLSTSPALDVDRLLECYHLQAEKFTLRFVQRQALESTLLLNATNLRLALDKPTVNLPALYHDLDFVQLETRQEVLDTYYSRYDTSRNDSIVMLCMTNATAAKLNNGFRRLMYEHDAPPIMPGELVLVVKNYYSSQISKIPFVANGELGRLHYADLDNQIFAYNHQWADVELTLEEDDTPILTRIPVDLLGSAAPALTADELRELWYARRADRIEQNLPVNKKHMRQDPFISAMQLKYGYAMTVHKAQGGQWQEVIVVFEPYMLPARLVSYEEFIRWTYTAITRAIEKVYFFKSPYPTEAL